VSAVATQATTDREQIQDLLVRYATGLDSRDWDLLASCFTEDGVADYGDLGGVNEGRGAIVSLCSGVLSGLDASQHMITNMIISTDGDSGRAVCYFQAQHVFRGTPGGDNYLVGGTYRDRLVRTGGEWRIAHRTLEGTWFDGNAAVFEAAAARLAEAQSGSGPNA
jgi:hypothetical protein